jgi:hypothetical protein
MAEERSDNSKIQKGAIGGSQGRRHGGTCHLSQQTAIRDFG